MIVWNMYTYTYVHVYHVHVYVVRTPDDFYRNISTVGGDPGRAGSLQDDKYTPTVYARSNVLFYRRNINI